MKSESRDQEALGLEFLMMWVFRTVIGLVIGAAAGGAAAQLFFCTHVISMELLGSILLGAILGAITGMAQYDQIRVFVQNPKKWVLASTAGWATAVFLFEVHIPISRCLADTNSSRYRYPFSYSIFSPIPTIAEQMERIIMGEATRGSVYDATFILLFGLLIGVVAGVPQGIAQWSVLRKELPRSWVLIWVNALVWSTPYILIMGIDVLMNPDPYSRLMLVPLTLIIPAGISARTLIGLKKKQMEARLQ